MKIISTNIGTPTTIIWNGKKEKTGIFKYPVNEVLYLEKNNVAKDTIIDLKHHGGRHKACYLFAADHYPYWKKQYPKLEWNWGMFGENLTVEGLNESKVRIGDIYKIGTALVQISQPREPCYKLGIRFKDQSILKKFIKHVHPGTYVKIIKEGNVKKNDAVQLVEQSQNTLTIQQFYELIFAKNKPKELLTLFMSNDAVPQYKKEQFKKHL